MPRILLVDDDPDILETLHYAFEKEGYEPETCADGKLALELARREPPDVAVLDVMLPGVNGYELARALKDDMRRGALRAFPILLLTARRVASDARQEFLSTWSGADATVWKPYDLGVLLHRVHELVQRASVTAAVPGDAAGPPGEAS